MENISFQFKKGDFFKKLNAKVNLYFEENKIKLTGNFNLFSKAIILTSTLVIIYFLLIFLKPGIISLFLSGLLGLNLAAIGFNIMHDGAHGSFSQKKWLNELCAYSLNVIGGNSFMWKIKHNVLHHSFANVEEVDDDIDIKPWMRIGKGDPKYFFHKFQHFYWVVLYGATYLLWVFFLDFQKYFTKKIASFKIKNISINEHVIFWSSKILYFGIFIIIPIVVLGFLNWLIGFLIATIVTGFTISLVFQLAHVSDTTDFPLPNKNRKIENDWATHQVETTADFSTKNKLVTWFLGGLNFQVVHHLFPKISHVHYPKLQKIVKETCDEFEVRYIEFNSVIKAIKAHVKHLKVLGNN